MSSGRDLVLGAYGYSLKNQPDRIASVETELLRVVNATLKGCYMAAARISPTFFGEKTTVDFDGAKWPIPANTESIWRIERVSDGTEVFTVAPDQLKAEPGRPCVYALGRALYGAGNSHDPTNEALRICRAIRHPIVANLDLPLDPSWDSDFDTLPILDIATYLAAKDGRSEEAQSLAAERDTWLTLFVAHIEHVIPNERRTFGTLRYTNPNSFVSIAQLLASGSITSKAT